MDLTNFPVQRGGFGETEHITEDAVKPEPPITHARARRYYLESVRTTADNDELCKRDASFYHLDQLDQKHKQKLLDRGQPPVIVPRIPAAINGVLGLVDASETNPECFPRNPEDQDASDIGTKVLRYLADKANFTRVRRILSEDKFIYGNCAAIVGEGAKTGDKSFKITPILWEDFFADPLSRYHDYSDARYLGIRRWCDVEEVKSAYPEAYAELGNPFSTGHEFYDQKDNDERKFWLDAERKRLAVIELYVLDENNTWQRLVFCDAGFLDFGESVYKDDETNSICPIVAVSYALNRLSGDRYGPIRCAIELQQEFNSRRSKMLHVTNSRQVRVVDENADLTEKELAKREAAKPDGVLPFGYDVVPTQDIFAGNAQLLQQTEADFDRLFPTPAVLGRIASGQSGRAYQMLQQMGYTEWSRAFARLEELELQIYRRLWFCAKQFMTEQTAVRITSEARVPEFEKVNVPVVQHVPAPVVDPQTGQPVLDPHTGQPQMQLQPTIVAVKNEVAQMDLDVTIDTVPKTETLENEVWAELLRYAASVGISPLDPNFEMLLQVAPFPNKTKTIERLRAVRQNMQQETAPQQQAQMAAQQQAQQLEQVKVQSKAQKETAQAHKAEAEAQLLDIQNQLAAHKHAMDVLQQAAAIHQQNAQTANTNVSTASQVHTLVQQQKARELAQQMAAQQPALMPQTPPFIPPHF